jgi:hypothetical protein
MLPLLTKYRPPTESPSITMSRVRWTKEQETVIKDANVELKAWLDKIGLKQGMSQKKPLPGANESVTAHCLAIAASLMEVNKEDGEPLFPECYTKVRLNFVHWPNILCFQ